MVRAHSSALRKASVLPFQNGALAFFREVRQPGVPKHNGVFRLVRRPLEDSPDSA